MRKSFWFLIIKNDKNEKVETFTIFLFAITNISSKTFAQAGSLDPNFTGTVKLLLILKLKS